MSFEAMSESLITDESAAAVESETHRPVTTSTSSPLHLRRHNPVSRFMNPFFESILAH